MANHKSAIKAQRQEAARRLRNRHHRSRLRTAVKKIRSAISGGDTEAAKTLLVPTISLVDTTVRHGVIDRNAAARTKSRLTRAVNRLAAS